MRSHVSYVTKRGVLGIAAIATVLAACGAPEPTGSGVRRALSTTALRGVVELEGLGACTGVPVVVEGPSGRREVSTTTGGTFEVADLGPGAYRLFVGLPGWVPVEEVLLVDGEEPWDVGTVQLVLDRVSVRGEVRLADGRAPSGSVVEVTGTAEVEAPAGVVCGGGDLGQQVAEVVAGETVLVEGDGSYEAHVPRRVRGGRVVVRRPGYTEEERSLPAVTGSEEEVRVAPVVLYPLTGFVNAVGGRLQGSRVVGLQVSAFNGVSEMGVGVVGGGAACTYGPWRAYAAEVTVEVPEDGVWRLCVRVRNDRGQELSDLWTEVEVDTAPPEVGRLASLEGVWISGNSVRVQVDAVDGGVGVAWQEVYLDGALQERRGPGSLLLVPLPSEGSHTVTIVVEDGVGNRTTTSPLVVTRDTQPPSGVGVTLAGGAVAVSDPVVRVALAALGASEMQLSEDGSFAGSVWQGYVSEVTWRLGGEGLRRLYARFRDEAGNMSGVVSDAVVVDTTAPRVERVEVAGGAVYAADYTVWVTVAASGTPATMEIVDEGGVRYRGAYVASTQVTLSPGEGARTVWVRLWDDLGNGPGEGFDTVYVDTTPPGGSVQIELKPAASESVELLLAAFDGGSGVSGVKLANDLASLGTTLEVGYDTEKLWTLDPVASGSEAVRAVWYQVIDNAGNASVPVSDWVVVDKAAPGSPTLELAGGAVRVASRSVTVSIGALGASEMQLSEDGSFAGSVWQPYASQVTWVFGGDGVRTLYARFRDEAGNMSGVVSDAVEIDRTAPVVSQVLVADGAPYAATYAVWVTVTASGGPATMEIVDEGGVRYRGAYVSSTQVTLSPGEGARTVWVRLWDDLGNGPGEGFDTVYVDTTPPGGSVGISPDPTGTEVVVLSLSAYDSGSGIRGVKLANDPASLATTLEVSYDSNKSWQLTSVGAGSEATRVVWYQVIDNAGNASVPVSDWVVVDKAAPTGGIAVSVSVTNSTVVGVDLSYSADASEMKLSSGSSCAGGTWTGVTTSTLWTLAPVDGTVWISARFRDAVGNESSCYATAVTYDGSGPVPHGMSVTGSGNDPGYTNQVTVTIDAWSNTADCVGYEIAEDVSFTLLTAQGSGCTLSSLPYALAGTQEGVRVVYLRFLDTLGNPGPVTSDAIVFDRTSPDGSFEIDGGDPFAGDNPYLYYTLTVNAFDAEGIFAVYFDRTGSWPAEQTAYVDGRASLVADYIFPYGSSSGTTQETIYMWLEDRAGNRTATPVSQSIVLDLEPPQLVDFTINGQVASCLSPPWSNDTLLRIDATVTLDAGSEVNAAKAGEPDNFSVRGFENYDTSQPFYYTASATNGVKEIRFAVRDRMGNVSTTLRRCVRLDTEPPVVTVSGIRGAGALADGYTASTTVTLRWSAVDNLSSNLSWCAEGDLASPVACDPGDPSVWKPFASSVDLYLSSGDGTKSLTAYVRDEAGNRSLPQDLSVVLDTVPPATPDYLLASPGSRKVLLRWAAVSDAVAYRVYYDRVDGVSTSMQGRDALEGVSPIEVVETETTLTGIFNYLPYYFRVRALDAAGNLSPDPANGVRAVGAFVQEGGISPTIFGDIEPTQRRAVLRIDATPGGRFSCYLFGRWAVGSGDVGILGANYPCASFTPFLSPITTASLPGFFGDMEVDGGRIWVAQIGAGTSNVLWVYGCDPAEAPGGACSSANTAWSAPGLVYREITAANLLSQKVVDLVLGSEDSLWVFVHDTNEQVQVHRCRVTATVDACERGANWQVGFLDPTTTGTESIKGIAAGEFADYLWLTVVVEGGSGTTDDRIELWTCAELEVDCLVATNWTRTVLEPGYQQDDIPRFAVGARADGGMRALVVAPSMGSGGFANVYVCDAALAETCRTVGGWQRLASPLPAGTSVGTEEFRSVAAEIVGERYVIVWRDDGLLYTAQCFEACTSTSSWTMGSLLGADVAKTPATMDLVGFGAGNLIAAGFLANGIGVARTTALAPPAVLFGGWFDGLSASWDAAQRYDTVSGYAVEITRLSAGRAITAEVFDPTVDRMELSLAGGVWSDGTVVAQTLQGSSEAGTRWRVRTLSTQSVGDTLSGAWLQYGFGAVAAATPQTMAILYPGASWRDARVALCQGNSCTRVVLPGGGVHLLRYADLATDGSAFWAVATYKDTTPSPATAYVLGYRCAGGCTTAANWQSFPLTSVSGELVGNHALVEVVGNDLWVIHGDATNNGQPYFYVGHCGVGTGCVDPAQWQWLQVGATANVGPLGLLATTDTVWVAYVDDTHATHLRSCVKSAGWSGCLANAASWTDLDLGNTVSWYSKWETPPYSAGSVELPFVEQAGVVYLAVGYEYGAQRIYTCRYRPNGGGCRTQVGMWRPIDLETGSPLRFVTDPWGMQLFFYDGAGLRYASCSVRCDHAGNWAMLPAHVADYGSSTKYVFKPVYDPGAGLWTLPKPNGSALEVSRFHARRLTP